MIGIFYNPIYFFKDLIFYFENCIAVDFLHEAKLTIEVLFNVLNSLHIWFCLTN